MPTYFFVVFAVYLALGVPLFEKLAASHLVTKKSSEFFSSIICFFFFFVVVVVVDLVLYAAPKITDDSFFVDKETEGGGRRRSEAERSGAKRPAERSGAIFFRKKTQTEKMGKNAKKFVWDSSAFPRSIQVSGRSALESPYPCADSEHFFLIVSIFLTSGYYSEHTTKL